MTAWGQFNPFEPFESIEPLGLIEPLEPLEPLERIEPLIPFELQEPLTKISLPGVDFTEKWLPLRPPFKTTGVYYVF